ncbi:hypothetical protein [Kitasatospora cineracea]|uniref:Uncharacterized protein n=1 Tax=Kitasatospora cineracea TaxID=88074 RepID=A0A3N4QZU0_9ACTN|nr:hypothetical protein [Kitasatospora cineracea]ROR35424.1 hypothetical protein EDD39_7082 [Kitasatospora cineracea]RPE26382.1 hypothetical protein EDD38_7697 [Kitasatospora cineracea]
MTTGRDSLPSPTRPPRPCPGGPTGPDDPEGPAVSWDRLLTAPRPFPSEHLQAAHELDLATSLVLAMPTAAASLDLLVNDAHIHPEGALVLGALLYVAHHREGAQFWWQFAAGGGSYTAASCLSLLHRSLGEFLDAEVWRRQAENLAAGPRPSQPVLGGRDTLLPAGVLAEILALCHEGLDVRLPPRLAAVIHQLPVDCDDLEYGELPQVSSTLVRDLAR